MTRAAVRERAQARRAADAAFREAFDAYMFECFAKPGFKLESEAQLAERFGVTRYKVRKAIEALNQAGVLERVKHGGSTVRSVTPEELADRADRLLSVAGLPAEEFEDAVSDLVCGLVPVIMDKVDPEKLAGLETLVETVGAARTPAERRSAVFDFLTGLAAVDGNRYTALCVSLAVRQAARREAYDLRLDPAELAAVCRGVLKELMKGRRKKVVAELEDLFGLVFPKRAELKKAEKTEKSEKAEKAEKGGMATPAPRFWRAQKRRLDRAARQAPGHSPCAGWRHLARTQEFGELSEMSSRRLKRPMDMPMWPAVSLTRESGTESGAVP